MATLPIYFTLVTIVFNKSSKICKKYTLAFLSLLAIAISACESESLTQENDGIVTRESKGIALLSATTPIQFIIYDGAAAIFNKADLRLYFLQLTSEAVLDRPENPINVYLNASRDALVITQGSGATMHYGFDDGIFGIGEISYLTAAANGLLVDDGQGAYNLDPDFTGDISAKCKCFTPGLFGNGLPSNCDAGGAGSSSCSVSGAGGDGGCSVTCTSGYEACCTNDDDFED